HPLLSGVTERLCVWGVKKQNLANLRRNRFAPTLLWIPGSYAPSIVREAQLLFKAMEKEGLQGGKGDNGWVVRHRHIPRPWNPTGAFLLHRLSGLAGLVASRQPSGNRTGGSGGCR